MKILFVDIAITGHRKTYLEALFDSIDSENVVVVPEKMDVDCKQCIVPSDSVNKKRSIFRYIKWILNIRKIVDKEKPDIVHFLYGDFFYRYFGILLKLIPGKKILTIHSIRMRKVEKISLKNICRKFDGVIVHSEYAKKVLNDMGIDNVDHVEYPQFNKIQESKANACDYFGLSESIPTIVCIGNTRLNKGLDILLEALKYVDKPFQLLIAGKPTDISEKYIDEHIVDYSNKVYKCLHFLTDEEFAKALAASDIIALPYRKSFNGASGPLGEGVFMDKCIVGPDHGNLSVTIKENHLGYVFKSEDASSLAEVLKEALKGEFTPDDKYIMYKNSIDLKFFENKYHNIYKEIASN